MDYRDLIHIVPVDNNAPSLSVILTTATRIQPSQFIRMAQNTAAREREPYLSTFELVQSSTISNFMPFTFSRTFV